MWYLHICCKLIYSPPYIFFPIKRTWEEMICPVDTQSIQPVGFSSRKQGNKVSTEIRVIAVVVESLFVHSTITSFPFYIFIKPLWLSWSNEMIVELSGSDSWYCMSEVKARRKNHVVIPRWVKKWFIVWVGSKQGKCHVVIDK